MPGLLGVVRHRWRNNALEFFEILAQENAYPWLAALIRDEDMSKDYVNTQCSATLVSFHSFPQYFHLNQIGSTWVVTAAHCLYKDGELVAAKSLSILLGLHDRSKKLEPNRCHERRRKNKIFFFNLISRRQIKVDKIYVHENYTATGSKANDIALLCLGDNNHISEKQELMDKKICKLI